MSISTIQSRRCRLQLLPVRAVAPFLLAAVASGCSHSSPTAPSSPTTPVTVQGSERFGWNQRSPSAAELAQYKFVAYVDGVARALSEAACQIAV